MKAWFLTKLSTWAADFSIIDGYKSFSSNVVKGLLRAASSAF
jgi:hypothetical protein